MVPPLSPTLKKWIYSTRSSTNWFEVDPQVELSHNYAENIRGSTVEEEREEARNSQTRIMRSNDVF